MLKSCGGLLEILQQRSLVGSVPYQGAELIHDCGGDCQGEMVSFFESWSVDPKIEIYLSKATNHKLYTEILTTISIFQFRFHFHELRQATVGNAVGLDPDNWIGSN